VSHQFLYGAHRDAGARQPAAERPAQRVPGDGGWEFCEFYECLERVQNLFPLFAVAAVDCSLSIDKRARGKTQTELQRPASTKYDISS
jgi:hypothetical protein